VYERKTTLEEFETNEHEVLQMLSQNENTSKYQKDKKEKSIGNISEVNEEHPHAVEEERDNSEAEEMQENDDEEEDFEMKMPERYHSTKAHENITVQEQVVGHDGKVQRTYLNGKKEVIFSNGVRRETFPDGYTIVHFNNNDIKQTYPDQKVVYYFADAKTTQTTFADGLQVFKFSN